jgi:hypothetical protein
MPDSRFRAHMVFEVEALKVQASAQVATNICDTCGNGGIANIKITRPARQVGTPRVVTGHPKVLYLLRLYGRSRVEREVTAVISTRGANSGRLDAPNAFSGWLQLTIRIRGLTYPSSIISTVHGDPILDPQLRGIPITILV